MDQSLSHYSLHMQIDVEDKHKLLLVFLMASDSLLEHVNLNVTILTK